MRPEIIYLAGPMTGRPLYNFEAFNAAKNALVASGNRVVLTPFDANNIVWNRHFGRDFDVYKDTCDWGDEKLGEIVLENQGFIVRCDTIAILAEWFLSKGTMQELVFGINLTKKIFDYSTEEYIKLSYKIEFGQHAPSGLVKV